MIATQWNPDVLGPASVKKALKAPGSDTDLTKVVVIALMPFLFACCVWSRNQYLFLSHTQFIVESSTVIKIH